MATAHPSPQATPEGESGQQELVEGATVMEVAPEELNQWKRGFTPQAEIWNGRMAMLGLSVGLTVLLIARLSGHV